MVDKKFLFMSADGFHEEQATSDTLGLGGLTMSGAIAMGTNKITGLGAGTDGTDAVNKNQLDAIAVGLSWKDPVVVLEMKSDADQGGTPPTASAAGEAWVVDNWGAYFSDGDIVEWDGDSWEVVVANSGAEPPNGTRVLVIGSGAAGSFSGKANNLAVYNSTTNTWAFTAPEDGDAYIIIHGYYADLGYTYNGTSFVQFTGLGQVVAGAGLGKTFNTIYVNAGDGIDIVGDAVAVNLSTTSGLELSGTTPDKTLQVKVDGAHGIVLGSTGLELEIDDTPDTLDVDADGLKVVGVPSLFKINGTAVGASVTAANIDDLVDGSNADTLHYHKKEKLVLAVGEAIAAGDPVYFSSANTVSKADAGTDSKRWAVGIASAAIPSGSGDIVTKGVVTGILTLATPGARYWLADTGGLTATRPSSGKTVMLIGYAINTTDLLVDIRDYGKAS